MAEKYSLGFIETSAKENLNVEGAFNRLITEVFNVLDKMGDNPDPKPSKGGNSMGGGEVI